MFLTRKLAFASLLTLVLSCSKDDSNNDPAPAASPPVEQPTTSPTGVVPPARVRSVFIQPYENCKQVPAANGGLEKVCTQVAISGATAPGRNFAEFASCQDVRTQRFFMPLPAANLASAEDPKLSDAAFMKELAWVTREIKSTGCACCHDSKSAQGTAKWDISAPFVWTEQLSDRGAAILAGEVDSATLGAFPKDQNHGFDRSNTGAPTTDPARMKAFFEAELVRRNVSKQAINAMDPLGGKNFIDKVTLAPTACPAGSGIDAEGKINWVGAAARYIYVLKPDSKAPVFPPNLDKPEGTLWKLDVAATAQPLTSGLTYGSIPAGSKQSVPAAAEPAPALLKGQSYWLYVLADVGFPISSCTFTF